MSIDLWQLAGISFPRHYKGIIMTAYGSVALYPPGNFTVGPGVPLPPPVTVSCAHSM